MHICQVEGEQVPLESSWGSRRLGTLQGASDALSPNYTLQDGEGFFTFHIEDLPSEYLPLN